jgi:hypothetical protein
MKIHKLLYVNHSGTGRDATHVKVIREFQKSKAHGMLYCQARGWSATIVGNILKVESELPFGFNMGAIVSE